MDLRHNFINSLVDTEQHESIYIGIIANRYLQLSKPQENPLAIITGGQPGSGKSSLAELAIERFSASGYVLVDADKMRPYHPEYTNLMRMDDKVAANLTHADCGPWATRLMRDGVAGRRNIIIDQTSRDPAAMEQITQQLRKSGYRVELHVMAVSAVISEQRIHQRYEGQRTRDGFGRFSTKEKHDEAFFGVASTVVAVEEGKQVDRLCLYNRNAHRIYDNQLVQGQWQQMSNARQTLDKERGRAMTPQEAYQFAAGYAFLVQQLQTPERNATTQEKEAMRARYEKAKADAAKISPLVDRMLLARSRAVEKLGYEQISLQDIATVIRQFDERAWQDLHKHVASQKQVHRDEQER